MNDIRYALRTLARSPGFAIIAVLTLALGIGINSAIFSAVDAVMLRPLPYPSAHRILSLWEVVTRERPAALSSSGASVGGKVEPQRFTVAHANLIDYRRQSHAFSAMAGFSLAGRNLTGSAAPERIFGEHVTEEYFDVLRIYPAQGRAFLPAEQQPANSRVVILTHELWRERFGADPHLLGSSLLLDGQPYQVVGIMPAGFHPPSQFGFTERLSFLVPLADPPAMLTAHGDHELNAMARLKDGASIEQARAEISAISKRLVEAYPDSNRGIEAAMAPLADDIIRNVRTSLVVLLAAVGAILLIACTNLANLLLVRAVGRRREISIRYALGASRARIVRELATHSAVLALFGCAAGLLLGRWMIELLLRLAPSNLPRLGTAGMDGRVMAFTVLLSLGACLLFGILPALKASKASAAESLKSSERNLTARSVMHWRNALMVAEIALSMLLLVGAGLLLKSFVLLSGVDLGFETEHVLAMNINLPEKIYATPDQRFSFFDDLAARVGHLPGVQSVGFANRFPLRGGWGGSMQILTPHGTVQPDVDLQAVNPGYFQTLGISLVRGRLFTPADRTGAPNVAVINTAFARRYLPGDDALGRAMRRNPASPWITIVGVVSDIRRAGKLQEIRPQAYLPAAQTHLYPVRLADFAVRTAGDPRALAAVIQTQVWAIDKDQPVTNVKTLGEVVSQSLEQRRFQMVLLVLFAALALVLALVGIYGVISYAVAQRTAEIGIRIALGARRGDILGLVLKQGLLLLALGIALGAAGAYALSRYLAGMLFSVRPTDPLTYAAVALLMAAVAVAASYIPAHRATRVDPMVALRYE
jgi:putative ABC transport system permease protein